MTAPQLKYLPMKTLFLDFDGVLHSMAQTATRPFERLALIEPLVDAASFQVVISSSWRFHFELHDICQRLGRLRGLVVGTTGDAVIGRHARYREIQAYVRDYSITDWRALDDAYLEFPDDTPELILCDPRVGVEESGVIRLREWLQT